MRLFYSVLFSSMNTSIHYWFWHQGIGINAKSVYTLEYQLIHRRVRQYTVESVNTLEYQLIHRGVRQYTAESVYTLEYQLIHRGVRQYTVESVYTL